jgi:hypothetical protein
MKSLTLVITVVSVLVLLLLQEYKVLAQVTTAPTPVPTAAPSISGN